MDYLKEKKPILSIIVPALNEEKYIVDTLKALNNQLT
jgi:glycosyltransferase involved in cell wall biosynthesis